MVDSRAGLTLAVAAQARKRAASFSEYEKRQAWMQSAEGVRMYRECRAKAQAHANLLGCDVGIELLWNGGCPGMVSWSWFGLPQKQHRYGHETTCEVVHPEDLSRTQRGHGYAATRPPSTVGPDYHGGPWVGRAEAVEASRKWHAAWDFETRWLELTRKLTHIRAQIVAARSAKRSSSRRK